MSDSTPAQRREQEERRQRDDDLRAILATKDGRRFVWRLIDAAGTVDKSFTGEALTGAYNEGRRSVGISLMVEAQRVASGDYVLMLGEQVAAAQIAEQLRKAEPAE